jgi:hypothetical protein
MVETIDTWLTRFAAGAGSTYVWALFPMLSYQGDRTEWHLRAEGAIPGGHTDLCPIAAEATLETGRLYRTCVWREAAEQQGILQDGAAKAIMMAADNDMQSDPGIRQRLLRICGLTKGETP